MDVDDPYGSDNFYDEIESLISPPGEYNLDDIEEILRSTDNRLDASLNFNSFDSTGDLYNFDIRNEFKPDFGLESYSSALQEQRTSASTSASTSTSDDDGFNPDDFIKFLNDDSMKVDEFTVDSDFSNNGIDDSMPPCHRRNTPSPTGSCSSSGGSSTSGIQSDASSIGSMTPAYVMSTEAKSPLTDNNLDLINAEMGKSTSVSQLAPPAAPPSACNVLPISVPLLSIQSTSAVLTTHTVASQITVVPQGSVIPLKTAIPLHTVQPFSIVKPVISAPVKIEHKLAPKPKTTSTKAACNKQALTSSINTINNHNSNTSTGNTGCAKPTPPPPPSNASKPKTIFLSSNDFKTLMQRMNSNGTKGGSGVGGGGAKITGAVNTQMPKIVMKTPNGKVITTNKIVQPLTSVNNKMANARFVSKIVSPNGSHVVIQQPKMQQQQSSSSSTTTTVKTDASSLSSSSSSSSSSSTSSLGANDSSVYKGIIDEKLFKKQQRMIKNRESASLSRKKKKEYVVSLESRINNLEKENFTLKGENKSLRSQLVAFAQTCHCKHSNISEFILNTLNAVENKPQHVKIAPKPAPKSLKQRMTAANIRKNVAVLFAMAFMVTLNVGNFQHFLNKNALETSMAEQSSVEEPIPQTVAGAATSASGRRLLWVETEAEYNEKLNRSGKRDAELDVPPLHFLHPMNRTTGNVGLGVGGSSTQQQQQHQQQRKGNATCSGGGSGEQQQIPMAGGMNQTENLRLASSLHKWIDGNANFLNLSVHEKFGNDELENPSGFKVTPDYYDMKPYDLPLQRTAGSTIVAGNQKRKYYVDDRLMYANNNKQRKMETDNEIDNSLELFKPKISDEYMRLFKGIKRQDDTFYVLSFNMDHILLPASSYNKISRPKMSLMLPTGDPSLNGDVTLMQIDCEVTNTMELMLKSFMIPEKLRPSKFAKNTNDVANNNETAGTQQQKPGERVFRQPATQSGSEQQQQQQQQQLTRAAMNISDKLMPKQKPVVRTFYLMGPKTQAAADAAKKKPTIIKLSGNETVVNGVVSVKNSTLYTKMRETLSGDEFSP